MSAQYLAVSAITGLINIEEKSEKNTFSANGREYTVFDRYADFTSDFYKDYEYSDIRVDMNEYRVAWKKAI